jgi:hypothetical protein
MSDTTTEQAQALRDQAAAADKRAADSFDRCDTDGFLSQWASNITARKLRMEAALLEAGGTHTFQGLFNAAGERVQAKQAKCPAYNGGYETKWLVFGGGGRVAHWVAIPQHPEAPSKRSKMGQLGLHEEPEEAPAKIETKGSGTGLAGAASVYVGYTRTDGGHPADAVLYEGGAS